MKRLSWLLLPVLAIPLVGCGPSQIPPASVGVLFDGSTGISQQLIKPQVVWVGMFDHLIIYPTSIKQASFVRAADEGSPGDDAILASTSEGALLPMDVTVEYHVEPENVLKAFTEFGTADMRTIQNHYIRWTTISAVNFVSGKHSIFNLISKDRATIGPQVKAELSQLLEPWGLTVDNVSIGEVHPSADIKAKIDESMNVRGTLEKAKVDRQRAIVDARTTITNAQRRAEQNRLLASQGEKAREIQIEEIRGILIDKWNGETPEVGDIVIPFTDIKVGK